MNYLLAGMIEFAENTDPVKPGYQVISLISRTCADAAKNEYCKFELYIKTLW